MNIAIIGCGRMGAIRAHKASELGYSISYFCDVNSDLSQSLKKQLKSSANIVCSLEDINWKKVDTIFLSTPPNIRNKIVKYATEYKKNLFIEKPLGINAEECLDNLKLINDSGIKVAIGYQNRLRPSTRKLIEILKQDQPLAVSCKWVNKAYAVNWWGKSNQSGGPINEQCAHIIDLLRYLFGDVQSVHAFLNSSDNHSSILTAAINLKFNNIVGTIIYSSAAEEKMIGLEIYTKNQEISLNTWNFDLVENNTQISGNYNSDDKNLIFKHEVEAFFKYANNEDVEGISTYQDAYKTQLVADSIMRSIATNKPVDIIYHS